MDPAPPRRATAAWILYDLANTAFSFNILSVFFPLWLNQELGLPDSVFAIGTSASMAVVLLLAPVLGGLSDRARRRMPFLVGSTLACVALTAAIGVREWPVAIVLFALANVGFQAGLIFYDSLLPLVSTPANRGRVAALGVGVGYLGSFVGLGAGALILAADPDAYPWVFAATAALFLLFALPAFFLVREPSAPPSAALRPGWVRAETTRTYAALARVLRGRDVPHVGRFLLGRILYTDAANTMIIFMAIYAINETGLSDGGAQILLAIGITGAALSAPLWGVLADRIGARHTLDLVLFLWMFGLAVVAIIPLLGLAKEIFFPLAFVLGGALAGLWSTDRPLLISLVPRPRIGEFFGYYAMVGRFAAISGPLAWALVVDALGLGRPAAVLTLLGFIVVAYAVLRRVPDPDRPGPSAVARFLPWRHPDGSARPLPGRWPLRAPASVLYLVVASALYFAYVGATQLLDDPTRIFLSYQIPKLTEAPLKTAFNFLTAVWINSHVVQYVYVVVLLLLFGVWFEIYEGTGRAVLVFYLAAILGGVVAGAGLHVLNAFFDAPWIERAWGTNWGGGSPGAFGLMGGFAARARRPWLLLLVFTMWEVNVAFWFLKSYTPAFHLTAMALGYVVTRRYLRPRDASQRVEPARPVPF